MTSLESRASLKKQSIPESKESTTEDKTGLYSTLDTTTCLGIGSAKSNEPLGTKRSRISRWIHSLLKRVPGYYESC